MVQLTISLDEETLARLRELAQQRGESLEETAKALIKATLPPETPLLSPHDPTGFEPLMSLAGSLIWPGTEGMVVNTTNEEIDRILAEEAMNPHEDE